MQASAAAPAASPEAITAIRLIHGWTQADLAAKAGIDRTQVWRIEKGIAAPYAHTLGQLAAALSVPISALLKT